MSDEMIDQYLGEYHSFVIERKQLNPTTVQLIFDDEEGSQSRFVIFQK
jgi:hypothetical protein